MIGRLRDRRNKGTNNGREGGREGRKEGRKEGRQERKEGREGGRKGRREGGKEGGRTDGRTDGRKERTNETHVRLLEYPVAFVVTGMFSLMLIYKEKKADFGFLVGKVSQIFASLARYGTKNTPTLCRERHI